MLSDPLAADSATGGEGWLKWLGGKGGPSSTPPARDPEEVWASGAWMVGKGGGAEEEAAAQIKVHTLHGEARVNTSHAQVEMRLVELLNHRWLVYLRLFGVLHWIIIDPPPPHHTADHAGLSVDLRGDRECCRVMRLRVQVPQRCR